ncbi:Asp-tRNA(Asn)/Glu-tRNA(Gln) amidotransferase subunit GatA [bacterium]|nr:Asp-tRNA(Asn)/Glu-tRNA(Gln) amidotransferase subunit GatA [bacterium]
MKRYRSLSQIRLDIDEGKVSCSSLVDYYLERIAQNSHLNAFLEIFDEDAKAQAKLVDQKLKDGSAGRLAGMVLAIKDNISYRGHHVSASSKILEGFEAVYTATAVERLIAEDVIIIGRCNCDEFAMGASNENSAYGAVKNADDESRVPGGSSGGSAVAVQADLCLAALGSDTGGSIRQPAAFTGNVGFKPTYGRVSRWGLLAYGSSFDQIGPISRSMEDCALIYEIMAGKDPHDATSSLKEVDSWEYSPEKKYKIGYIKETIEREGIDSELKAHFNEVLDGLKADGHEIEAVSFPYLDYMVPCYYVLTTAEASSNLSRYSGMLYGHRSSEAQDIDTTFIKSRSEGFGEEVKRRIMTGTFVLSADYYDAYYTKAQKVRRVIQNESKALLDKFDFLISPTTPTAAFKLGEKASDPIQMYLADIYTVQAPLAGLPAISIPTGRTKDGLAIGTQVMGNSFEEKKLFNFCKQVLESYENL